MIGQIQFDGLQATLESNGIWRSDDATIQNALNALYDPRDGYSVADGFFGVKTVYAAAKALGGIAKVAPVKSIPGRIY